MLHNNVTGQTSNISSIIFAAGWTHVRTVTLAVHLLGINFGNDGPYIHCIESGFHVGRCCLNFYVNLNICTQNYIHIVLHISNMVH